MLGEIRQRNHRMFFGLALFLLLTAGAIYYEVADEQGLEYAGTQPVACPEGDLSIVVKVDARVLELYANDALYKRYRIAVGKGKSPTPIGEWKVVYKSYSDKEIFGTRWMGLNVPWGSYGIHGTNRPWSIGQFASQGCIRLRNKDIEELFEWIPIGTPVKIVGKQPKVNRTLKYQTAGPDVVTLQLRLQTLGFFGGVADGLFGKSTEEAVKHYQENAGLTPNGVVDESMQKRLGI